MCRKNLPPMCCEEPLVSPKEPLINNARHPLVEAEDSMYLTAGQDSGNRSQAIPGLQYPLCLWEDVVESGVLGCRNKVNGGVKLDASVYKLSTVLDITRHVIRLPLYHQGEFSPTQCPLDSVGDSRMPSVGRYPHPRCPTTPPEPPTGYRKQTPPAPQVESLCQQ